MMSLFERRKKCGMSQFLCAQRSGISRMRLSLAETGQIALSPAEEGLASSTDRIHFGQSSGDCSAFARTALRGGIGRPSSPRNADGKNKSAANPRQESRRQEG
jgi:transcriptional regulator with XRE-family HTH domain